MKNFRRLVIVFAPNSTRARQYFTKVRPQLLLFAEKNRADFREIAIDDLPYFTARETISREIADGDLVVAAGGDGLVNVTLDAAISSGKSAKFATIPLGNFNDFSHSINGQKTDPKKILAQKTRKFYPLEIRINREPKLFVAQYITFGAGAELAKFLNSETARNLRKKVRGNRLIFGLSRVMNYNKIFRKLKNLKDLSPKFSRFNRQITDNEIGFFLGKIGGYFSPRGGDLHFSQNKNDENSENFFFHFANLSGKFLRDVPKISSWAIRGLPGEISDFEKLTLFKKSDLICQIGGDELILKNVREISAERSRKFIEIFAKD